jgi:tetratricopeptide (TPR) repeat protein
MAAAGRFTPGPGVGYAEAIHHLRRLLAHYHLREEHDLDADPDTTVSVRILARRAAAGQGPPMDLLLRERSLRVGLANLGNLHRLEKRFDAALDCYGAAIYCEPGYVEAYAERAWVHLERADRAAAAADIRCALERDVGTPQQKARILIGYADALERVGLEIEQGPWLDEARGRDPGNPRVEDLSRRWKERFGDPA